MVYHMFLLNVLPVCFEDVPLQQRQHTWLIHDAARTHFLRIGREHLKHSSGGKQLERSKTVNWPARSADLDHLDFWFKNT